MHYSYILYFYLFNIQFILRIDITSVHLLASADGIMKSSVWFQQQLSPFIALAWNLTYPIVQVTFRNTLAESVHRQLKCFFASAHGVSVVSAWFRDNLPNRGAAWMHWAFERSSLCRHKRDGRILCISLYMYVFAGHCRDCFVFST